jgi:hypothetical protein
MARNAFIKIDASEVFGLGDAIGRLTPEELGRRMVQTINTVTTETYDLARKTMLDGINLTDAYVQRKMDVTLATEQLPRAVITAARNKGSHTNLSEYGAMTAAKPVTWSNERIAGMGVKFSKWPGWTQRTGNKSVGVAVNQKAAGTSVEVRRGARKQLTSKVGFQVGKLKDGSGNPLVFERVGSKIKAMYGPSVYQLFAVASGQIEKQVADNLYDAVVASADQAMKEILA